MIIITLSLLSGKIDTVTRLATWNHGSMQERWMNLEIWVQLSVLITGPVMETRQIHKLQFLQMIVSWLHGQKMSMDMSNFSIQAWIIQL